jgi:MSHA pilin protein MshC
VPIISICKVKYSGYKLPLNGFTLLELIMVIVITGVMAVVTVPKFFNYKVFQQNGFFIDTLNAIRYAQKLAVATACNVQVAISGNQYTITRPAATDRSQCTSTTASNFTLAVARPGSGQTSYQGSLSGISLTSTSPTFYFYAKGNASAGVTISVGSNQIIVVPDTGYVYTP